MSSFIPAHQGSEKMQVELDNLSKLTCNYHNSYPNKLLDIFFDIMVNIVHGNMPLRVLEKGSYRKNVHIPAGVKLFSECMNIISLGLKYLLYSLSLLHLQFLNA